MQQGSLRGAWQRDRGNPKQEEIKPQIWRWNDMAPLLLEAGELAPLDDVMRMRTLHMTNSPDTIPRGAARTFAAMLQHVNGGEVTDSHRHTATSVFSRFRAAVFTLRRKASSSSWSRAIC